MAQHALKTPVLVGVAAIAVIIGTLAFRGDSDVVDVVDVVPPCTAPQGQFCLQLKLHEGMWGRPANLNENRVFDLVFIEGDRAEIEATLPTLSLDIYDEEEMYAGVGAYLGGLTQGKFDEIPADYRVTGAKDKV